MSADWTEWNGLPASEADRDRWAEEIASGAGITSTMSGDSFVIGDVDTEDDEALSVLITDCEIRRWRRAPLAPDSELARLERLRRASHELADALAALLADHAAQCECQLVEQARAALRAAGRLP